MNDATEEYIELANTIAGLKEKLRERNIVDASLRVNSELARNRQIALLQSGEVDLEQVKHSGVEQWVS